jgi:anti-sigma factor RsiW
VTSCRTASGLLWPYLDHELVPGERTAVTRHLAGCAHCRALFAFHRSFLRAVRMAGRAEQSVGIFMPPRALPEPRPICNPNEVIDE